MKNNAIMYQLNPLVEAQKDFDVMESRLFYLGLKDVNPHITTKDKYYDTQFPDTVISPSELIKIFGHPQYIAEVDKATDRLIGRFISIRFEGGFEKYTIFQHIKYRPGKGLFIKFNEDMRPFILDIYANYKKYGFTQVEMQQIFVLSSMYAMRIMELLLQYKSTAKNGIITREISLEKLRQMLNVPDGAYKGKMCNFRRCVLDLPIADINKSTRYIVSYDVIKQGRKVSGFVFSCNCNNVPKDSDCTATIEIEETEKSQELQEVREIAATAPAPEVKKSADNTDDWNDDAADALPDEIARKMLVYGISEQTVKRLLSKCDDVDDFVGRLEYAEDCLRNSKKNGTKIGNLAGYIRKSIEENWKGQNAAATAAKTKQETESLMAWVDTLPDETDPDKPVRQFNENDEKGKACIAVVTEDVKKHKLSLTSINILNCCNMSVRKFVELYMQ